MSINLRHKEILDILEENGSVSIKILTKRLYVSEATVRRDLAELERSGSLKRTHGGAQSILETNRQIPLSIREELDADAKNQICRRAAELVKEGATVFIDGSSTAQHIIKYLSGIKDINVVTYSIRAAEMALREHIRTYCAGGLLIENSLVCTGQKTVDFAESINADICFISCKGMDSRGRFTDTSEEETAIRKAFIKNSATRVMLMTSNKSENTYLHTLCTAEQIDYIFCDTVLPEAITKKLRGRGEN
jgi:DeoR/GlpR family transcriptional regulator of sugar metabolism